MRLYLAVAVLVLAMVAYTEAQEDTIQAKFTKFGEQMDEMRRNLAEKAKASFDDFQASEFAVNSRSWFETLFNKIKIKTQELTQ